MEVTIEGQERLNELARNAINLNMRTQTGKMLRRLATVAERGIKGAITGGWTRALDTGLMRSSVRTKRFTEDEVVVGTNVGYAIYPHEGTRFMKARPFIPVGWENETDKVNKVLAATGKSIVVSLTK